MAVGAREKHGMLGCDGIEIEAIGKFLCRPQSVIPAGANDPFTGAKVAEASSQTLLKFIERLAAAEIHFQFAVRRRWRDARGHR